MNKMCYTLKKKKFILQQYLMYKSSFIPFTFIHNVTHGRAYKAFTFPAQALCIGKVLPWLDTEHVVMGVYMNFIMLLNTERLIFF